MVLLLFSVFFFLNSLSASTNDNTGQTNTGATVKIREAIGSGRRGRDNSCDCENQQTPNERELHKCFQVLRTSIGYGSDCDCPPSQVSSKHEVHLYWYFSKTSIFWSLNAHIWRHNRGTNSIRTASFHDWPFARHFPLSHNTYLQWKNVTFSASAVGRLCHSIKRERHSQSVRRAVMQ